MNPRSSAPAVKYLEVIVDKQSAQEASRRKIKNIILHENVCRKAANDESTTERRQRSR